MALVSTVIALTLGELAVRLLSPQVLSVPVVDYVDGLSVNLPNVRGRQSVHGTYDVIYRTNSQRFRGVRESAERPAPGTIRIAAIGDSFTFGIGVEDDEAYPAVLEGLLLKRGAQVEVLNAGVGGTGTDTQSLWFDRWVGRFHPRIVVLSVLSNDIEEDQLDPLFTLDATGQAIPMPLEKRLRRIAPIQKAKDRAHMIPGYAFLGEHSHLLNLARRVQSHALRPGGTLSPTPEQMRAARAQFVERRLGLEQAELRWLKQRVEAAGGTLVVTWYPMRELIYDDPDPIVQEKIWRGRQTAEALAEFTGREGVPFFDATEILEAPARTDHDLYFWGRDYHPRPEGHRVFAAGLAAFLERQGLISEPPAATRS